MVCSNTEPTSEIMNPFRRLGRTLVGGSAHCKASTYTGQHATEKRGHTSIPRAGFEPVFKRSKTTRA
jgi:hypothetical protein